MSNFKEVKANALIDGVVVHHGEVGGHYHYFPEPSKVQVFQDLDTLDKPNKVLRIRIKEDTELTHGPEYLNCHLPIPMSQKPIDLRPVHQGDILVIPFQDKYLGTHYEIRTQRETFDNIPRRVID